MVWYDYNFFAMNIIVYWQQTSMFLKNQSFEPQPSFDFISLLPNDSLEKELLWSR